MAAINPRRDMKFSDLSDAVKLVVTKWLPKKVTIALIDVFPPVINQIKSVSLQQLTFNKPANLLTDDDINQAVDLYSMLTKVTKISCSQLALLNQKLADAIGSNLRPDIEYFCLFDGDDDGFKYIEMLVQKYPDYDGSRIITEFCVNDYPDYKFINFIRKNPDLKLKLRRFVDADEDEDLIIHVKEIQQLIKSLTVRSSSFHQLLNHSIQFVALEKLSIQSDETFPFGDVEKIRFFNPKIRHLTLKLDWIENWNAFKGTELADCILSLEHLESLTLHFDIPRDDWDDHQVSEFYSMVTTLVTTEKRSLTHLDIQSSNHTVNAMSIQLWNSIRNGFNFFNISLCYMLNEQFQVNKFVMRIRNFEVSLIDVFNKFPHVKLIMVMTEDEAYKQRLRDELEVIRSELPRNQSVTLQFFDSGSYWEMYDLVN